MKNSQSPRTEALSARRAKFALAPVAVGCAVMLITSGAAYAQSTTSLDTVVVTGIRKGIEDAISVKKNTDTIVEAISAEDIGKLPDTTIADSLARLPGVTTQRTAQGNASTISIRGLGPDFNGYLLNGREQTSTGDSRAVDLSVYPTELIAGATVYKTGDATLMSAGLAGTIDNHLIDPLAFPSRVLAASVQKIRNTIGVDGTPEGTGNRQSLTYIDQFADRTVGIALGFVRADGTSSQTHSGGWGGGNNVTVGLAGGGTAQGKSNSSWGTGVDFNTETDTDKRSGVAAIVAFKPTSSFTSQLDMYYAKIDTGNKQARFQGGLNDGAITNATVANGLITSGTYQLGVGGLIDRSEYISDDDTVKSVGWKNVWKMANGWTATLDLSSNSAERTERDIEAYAGIPTTDTLSFVDNGGTPQFTLGRATDYTNPAIIKVQDQTGWSGVNCPDGLVCPQAGYSKGPTIKDQVQALRLDFKTDLNNSMFSEVIWGLNYTDRSKDRTTDEGVLESATNNGHDPFPFPASAYVASNVAGTGINLLTFDPTSTLWPGAVLLRKYNDDILSKTWSVSEKVTTAFAKFNIDTTYGNMPVRGNVGVQVVGTDQSSAGYQANVGSGVTLSNPAGSLTTLGKTYTDILPSVNLTGDLGGGNLLRVAMAEQIARPTMTDMRNSFAASVDLNSSNSTFGHYVGSAGNPLLMPFKATALDVSFEKYFGKTGYLSAAAFYKKLDTYITPATNYNYDFSGYVSALGLQNAPMGNTGTFTNTVNGSGGNVQGVELAVSAPFNLVTSVLDGFGVTASYSVTDSSVNMPNIIGLNPTQQVPVGGQSIQLPGLSKDNAKLMLYFEKWGFSAFVADNYRSTYVGSVANTTIGGYPTLEYIEGSSWVSAQFGYEFREGPMKGLGLRLEGNNLNRPVYRQLKADGSEDFHNSTGSTLMFKLTYKLQ